MNKISIIIPSYNEENTLAELVGRVQKADICSLEKEIIIVDNNSMDKTLQIAESLPGVKVFQEKKKGKGAAVKRGFREATGDILVIQDADLEYDPNDLDAIARPILDGKTKVTNGVRIDDRHRNDWIIYFLGSIGNFVITWTTNILYKNNAGEYEGCYKAVTKELYDTLDIKADDFDFENEMICKLLKSGYKTVDVPIHYYPRSYEEGKKITWKNGVKILWTVIRTRFTK